MTEKKKSKSTNRWKNISTYIGIFSAVSMILTAAGIDAGTMTSWPILWHSIENVLLNPGLLASVIATLIATYANPTTKGITD